MGLDHSSEVSVRHRHECEELTRERLHPRASRGALAPPPPQAERALQERRRVRQEADERMRKPYRPPPAAKASGGAARQQRKAQPMGSPCQAPPRPAGRGAWSAAGAGAAADRQEARQLRAARRGELREFISHQRGLLQVGAWQWSFPWFL